MMSLLRLPRLFFEDHGNRDLPTPEPVRETKKHVFVRREDAAVRDLLEDAQFYCDPYGPDLAPRGLIASARATVKAIQSATARKEG